MLLKKKLVLLAGILFALTIMILNPLFHVVDIVQALEPLSQPTPTITINRENSFKRILSKETVARYEVRDPERLQFALRHQWAQYVAKRYRLTWDKTETRITRGVLRDGNGFWQYLLADPKQNMALIILEMDQPLQNPTKRCRLESEVLLLWKTKGKIYVPFAASNGNILREKPLDVGLFRSCPGYHCSGWCDHECIYPEPPEGDRFCREMLCATNINCAIECGLGCPFCAYICATQSWAGCVTCVLGFCNACIGCFDWEWVCDVCP